MNPNDFSSIVEIAYEESGIKNLVGSTDHGAYLDLLISLGVDLGPYKVSKSKANLNAGSGTPSASSTGASPNSSVNGPDPLLICKDGERTTHLCRLAGMWIRKGKTIEETVLLAMGWNASNTPPLDSDKVAMTCEGIYNTHLRNHPGSTIETGSIKPLFDLSEARIDSMIDNPPPQRRWLLNDFLPLGVVGMIVAPGGTGKSMFSLQLGASLACGEPLANFWKVGEQGSSLLLFAEEDVTELHRRVNNIATQIFQQSATATELLKAHLFVKSMVGLDTLMTRSAPGKDTEATEFADRLIMSAKQIPDLKLILIDPASRFRGGVENSAEDTTRFVQQLERVSQATGATVLVLHHVNKGSSQAEEASSNASRGSSALTDGVRWQMNLAKPNSKEAKTLGINGDMRHRRLIAAVTKNNYGPPQADVLLARGEGGYLSVCAAQMIVDPLKNLIDLITFEEALGNEYSANTFEKKFGGIDGPLKIGKVALRDIIRSAIKSQRIHKKIGGRRELRVLTKQKP